MWYAKNGDEWCLIRVSCGENNSFQHATAVLETEKNIQRGQNGKHLAPACEWYNGIQVHQLTEEGS